MVEQFRSSFNVLTDNKLQWSSGANNTLFNHKYADNHMEPEPSTSVHDPSAARTGLSCKSGKNVTFQSYDLKYQNRLSINETNPSETKSKWNITLYHITTRTNNRSCRRGRLLSKQFVKEINMFLGDWQLGRWRLIKDNNVGVTPSGGFPVHMLTIDLPTNVKLMIRFLALFAPKKDLSVIGIMPSPWTVRGRLHRNWMWFGGEWQVQNRQWW